jgi:hypothetical protein
MAANDIIGGRLTVSFEGKPKKSTELTADEAYELLKYADGMRRKRRRFGSLKALDRAVWGMHEGGMSVPAIADALNVSQARVEGAIGRVEAGRYGGEGVI